MQEGAGRNLRDDWIVIRKYRWTIVIFLLPVVLIAAIFAESKPRTYSATATLYFDLQPPSFVGTPQVISLADRSFDNYYKTQVDLLKSRSLAARVIQELGLNQDLRFQTHVDGPPSWTQSFVSLDVGSVVRWLAGTSPVKWIQERFTTVREDEEEDKETEGLEYGVDAGLIDRYLGQLGVSHERTSQLVRVRFTSLNPSFSKEVANAHASTFIRTNLQTHFEGSVEARQFLDAKLMELTAVLEKSEAELNQLRKTHAIVSLEQGQNLILERLTALNRDLTETRSRRIELESIVRAIENRDNQDLSQVIDNPLVQRIKDQLSTLEMERARLATISKPSHPQVTSLKERIDEAKNRMNQEVRHVVQSITSDYSTVKARELALTDAIEEQRRAALDLREKAIEASILEREVETNQMIYANILKRSKETRLSESVPASHVRVIDQAERPSRPDKGKWKQILFLGVFGGLLGGVGLAFLRHYLDNTLKTPEDVGRFLHLPTLGMVPDIRRLHRRVYGLGDGKKISLPQRRSKSQQGESGFVIPLHASSLVSEAYQTLCTALRFSLPDRSPRTILITSSQPQEGKTATAINIAITLARKGASVLLIDADLRNGHCHRLLDRQNGSGLTHILTGQASATECIQNTAIDNLSLLSRGELSANPAALLDSEKMQQVLESLEPDFSFIIIDSAPLLPIADTILLSTKVDGVLLVIKAQEVSRYVAGKGCELLGYVNARILGVLLNNIDIRSPEYEEYRSSYEGYYAAYTTKGSSASVPSQDSRTE